MSVFKQPGRLVPGAAVFLFLTLSVHAEPGLSVRKHDPQTRLMLYPLRNNSGDPTLDYLGQGIMRMLSGRLDKITYVRGPQQTPAIQVQTAPLAAGNESPVKERFRLKIMTSGKEYSGESLTETARKQSLRYLIYGSYTVRQKMQSGVYRNDLIQTEVFLFDSLSGYEESFTFTDNLETIYKNTDKHFSHLISKIRGSEAVKIRAESEPPGAMVFLDEQYLGRTPAEAEVIPSDYSYQFSLDGHRTVNGSVSETEIQKGAVIKAELIPVNSGAVLEVTSEPEGAEVFLNMKFLGVTPLTARDLPEGKHRLRFSKEGYADRFTGVSLKSGKKTAASVTLLEGSSEDVYLKPDYVVMDWGYYDLAFASALSSLAFYGGYWYYETKAENRMNELRTVTGPLMIYREPEPWIWYLYHMNRNTEQVNRLRQSADISAGLGVTSLLFSGFFLYKYFESDSRLRDPGEIRFTPAASVFSDGDKNSSLYMGVLLRF